MALRVVVADDHRLILAAIRCALAAADDIEVVGEARSGSEVLPLVARTNPDLALIDLGMPGIDGMTCLELIRQRHPTVKVVVLSAFDDPQHIQRALERGASAYIVKTVTSLDLPTALRDAAEGNVHQPVGLSPSEPGGVNAAGLTEREATVLKALARGLSNHAISQELWVTEQTVKFHLSNIYRKLDVANRTEAARYAFQHRLVESGA